MRLLLVSQYPLLSHSTGSSDQLVIKWYKEVHLLQLIMHLRNGLMLSSKNWIYFSDRYYKRPGRQPTGCLNPLQSWCWLMILPILTPLLPFGKPRGLAVMNKMVFQSPVLCHCNINHTFIHGRIVFGNITLYSLIFTLFI